MAELVSLCIPNQSKEQISNSKGQYYFKLINGFDQNNSTNKQSDSGNSTGFKNFWSEYGQENNDCSIICSLN